MTRTWFAQDLETVATFWRILRRDGIALGFTSHDRDLWFDDLLHHAAPGLLPSAIHRTSDAEPDGAEMKGALEHRAIRAGDLAAGRFDGARVSVGVVDWETGENKTLFTGSIGTVGQDGASFTAELLSAKLDLARELVPRTAPTCRAEFCGPGCTLSAARFIHEGRVSQVDAPAGRVHLSSAIAAQALAFGTLRWVDGPAAGMTQRIVACEQGWLVLDTPLDVSIAPGLAVEVLEGCDHTLATCHARFANAVNFQGEPFLPGNDLLTRYASPAA